jgi:site-specific recombinase
MRLLKRNKASTEILSKKGKLVVLPTGNGLVFLISLIKTIRPSSVKNSEEANLKFKVLLYQLSQNRSSLFSLRKALLSQFLHTNLITALTENGIVSSRGFGQELMGKLKHKILPALLTPNDFLYVINKVFYRKNDYVWVQNIEVDLWKQFFELLGIQVNLTESALIGQLNQSLQILSYRVATLGLEKEMLQGYENKANAIYPFLEQNKLVNTYLAIKPDEIGGAQQRRSLLYNITEALHNCNQSILWIKEQRKKYGTSLAQTYILTRLQQQIDRLFIILDVLDGDNQFNTERFVEYFKTVIKNENRKNSLKEFLSENTGYLAYQIAEHGGKRGEDYITTTRKDFWKMFWSAAGGGVIISFVGIIKNLLGKIAVAPFWQGFLYSANYSLGFILIQETKSTLATKQPAYTANNVASSFDAQKIGDEPDLRNLAITVAKVSRTQLASFAGNLMVVFPLTYLLAMLFFNTTGSMIASGDAAQKLLTDQQPFHSLALLYACFTGFFLFASGIIAGYVENYVVYGKVADRMRSGVGLRNFSDKWRNRIIRYVQNNLGSLIGNISLGFFLGMAGFFGKIFGLPFDIRHITISAANTAIGYFGLNHHVPFGEMAYTVLGVFLIGFINFAVSFALAFYVAVKSRGIHLKEYPEFLGMLWSYFKKFPKDFIKAPRERRVEELG